MSLAPLWNVARAALRPTLTCLALLVAATGCADKGKRAQQHASAELGRLLPLVAEDVRQMRQGMPPGAAEVGRGLAPGALESLPMVQKAIRGARAGVQDLYLAKGTFFAFANRSGLVLRSESDPDLLSQHDVFAPFPTLKRALEPGGGLVEAFGEMQELRGVRTGADTAWVLAHAVPAQEGEPQGVFVGGWSFRRYAFRLEEQARRDVREEAQKKEEPRVPIVYVFALRGAKAYGAPVTPEPNMAAVEQLDPLAKAQSGAWTGQVEISGRVFGVAAQRTPELAPDTGVAVMLSEL